MSKTWLITGASAGLGRLMTERLLTRGDRVVGTVRREGALAQRLAAIEAQREVAFSADRNSDEA